MWLAVLFGGLFGCWCLILCVLFIWVFALRFCLSFADCVWVLCLGLMLVFGVIWIQGCCLDWCLCVCVFVCCWDTFADWCCIVDVGCYFVDLLYLLVACWWLGWLLHFFNSVVYFDRLNYVSVVCFIVSLWFCLSLVLVLCCFLWLLVFTYFKVFLFGCFFCGGLFVVLCCV